MEKSEKRRYSAGIYARLSVDHGIKNESIASQIAIAKSYLAQQEEMDLYDCYIDLGESGTHFQRNGFFTLMEDIRSGKVNCVIVKDFSRFGRNYIEVGNYIDKIFPFLGVRFISVADGFDSQNREESEMDKNLKNLINELYASDTARKVKEVKKLYREQESYVGGRAPYGYQIKKIEGKRTLVADKMALEVVKKILQFYLEGKSQREIAVWLFQNRVHRPSDYRKTGHIYCKNDEILLEWKKGSIGQILKNPVYMQKEIGILTKEQYQMIQDRNIKQSKKGKGLNLEKIRNGEEEKSVEIEGNQNSNIVKYLDRKEKHTIRMEEKASRNRWKGMLYCGECNHALSYRGDLKRKIYDCSQAKRLDILKCKKKPITEEVLSSCVISLVQHIIQKKTLKKEDDLMPCDGNRKELAEYVLKKAEEYRRKQMLQLRRMEIRIATQRRLISDHYRDYQIGKIGKEEFLAKKAAENKKTENLVKQQWKNTQQMLSVDQILEETKDWMERIEKEEQVWLKETAFLSCVIKRIKLFCGKRIVIQFQIRR